MPRKRQAKAFGFCGDYEVCVARKRVADLNEIDPCCFEQL